jgi:hypothetical protein
VDGVGSKATPLDLAVLADVDAAALHLHGHAKKIECFEH